MLIVVPWASRDILLTMIARKIKDRGKKRPLWRFQSLTVMETVTSTQQNYVTQSYVRVTLTVLGFKHHAGLPCHLAGCTQAVPWSAQGPSLYAGTEGPFKRQASSTPALFLSVIYFSKEAAFFPSVSLFSFSSPLSLHLSVSRSLFLPPFSLSQYTLPSSSVCMVCICVSCLGS